MYLNHYGLSQKPFDLSLKPGFLWLGEEHAEALATLNYGIQEDMGFLLLTGDVGVGKTALIRRLINNLTSSTIVAHITDPGLEHLDFFKVMATEFGIDAKFSKKAEFLITFKTFLQRACNEQRKVLLIIDEAQRLNDNMLDHIRVLSNIERGDRKLINIFFVGQPEFKDMLMTEKNRALRQRIAVNYHVNPLTEVEVGHYIEHRLKKAGVKRRIFEDDAVHEIFTYTNGFPRAINIICDHALMSGYSYGMKTIDGNVIKECTEELRIREERKYVEPISQKPVAVRLSETIMAPTPKKKPLFATRTYPLLIGICVLLAVFLSFLLMRPGPSETTQVAPADTSRDVLSENTGPSMTDNLQSFSKDPVPPLANDEWRQEDKMEIERALAPDRFEARSQQAANDNADVSEKSDTLLATRQSPPEPDTEIQTSSRASDGKITEDRPSSTDSKAAAVPTKKEPVSSSPASTLATSATDKGKAEEPVAVSNKSIEAMAVMSAALATKETASKPAAKSSPLVGNRPAVSTSDTIQSASVEASTNKRKTEPSQVKKSDTTSVSSASKTAKKTTTKGKTNTAGSVVAGAAAGAAASAVIPTAQTKTGAAASTKMATSTTATSVNRPASSAVTPKKTNTSPTLPKTTGSQAQTFQETDVDTSVASSGEMDNKPNLAGLDNRLRWFLKSYCITYMQKDLDTFTRFFVPGATENGKNFESLVPKYKRNFELIETIQYRIDMKYFTYDKTSASIKVFGNFSLQWLPPDRKWRENTGTITMQLIEKGTSFMVQQLDYHGNG